jgi:ATP-binding cassette subfamily F protein 3
VVEVAGGQATSHLGNYEDFLRAKGGEGHSSLRVETTTVSRTTPVADDKAVRIASHAERKATQRETQRREKQLAEVEARIAGLEEQVAGLVTEMQDPAMATDHARLYPLIERHGQMQAELDAAMARWEELQAEAGEAG